MTPRLVLASASPRRVELLKRLTPDFDVLISNVDETVEISVSPKELVKALSMRKARAVLPYCGDAVVIGADTVVVLDNDVLGKPRDRAQAASMLGRLQGRAHEVYTGVSVLSALREDTVAVRTAVVFAPMSEREIEAYVATGEPMDKAGAYGIQGAGGAYICEIHGNYENVMGLPLYHLRIMLQKFGIKTL